jgi:hypothetical protein
VLSLWPQRLEQCVRVNAIGDAFEEHDTQAAEFDEYAAFVGLPGINVSSFGFRVLSFGFRVSGFEFQG